MDIEGARLLRVLEDAVDALELVATVPMADEGNGVDGNDDGDDGEDSEARDQVWSSRTHGLSEAVAGALDEHCRLEKAVLDVQQSVVATRETPTTKRPDRRNDGPEDDDDDEEEEDREHRGDGNGGAHSAPTDEDPDLWWLAADDGAAEACVRYPRSLHRLLTLLSHDKPARDALRRLTATRISPAMTAFVHHWTDVIMATEHRLSTSPEQDERRAKSLRDTSQRLREIEDDRRQVQFELDEQRAARAAHGQRDRARIHALREQLRETQRVADEALGAIRLQAEHDRHTAQTQAEAAQLTAQERLRSLERVDERATDAHQHEEGDERKRRLRQTAELAALLHRYDEDMAALDAAIADEHRALAALAPETATLGQYFARVDEDRRFQLEERRQRDEAEARRRREELNVFRFIQRLQAVVRGFLTRRQTRLLLLKKRKKRKKTKKGKTKKASSTKPKSKRSESQSPRRRPPSATPRRPTSANGSRGRRPPRPSSAAVPGAR